MGTSTFNTMSKTWAKVGGAWKEIADVWVNVGGVWKSKIIPSGRIGGEWRDFKSYSPSGGPANPPIVNLPPDIFEDFTGDVIQIPHQMGEEYPWIWDKEASPTGDVGFLRTSNPSIPNSKSQVTFFVDIPDSSIEGFTAILELKYAVSSERSWDVLNISLDGAVVKTSSSTVDGGLLMDTFYIPLSPGRNNVLLSYDKDGSADYGSDCAYLDSIAIKYSLNDTSKELIIFDDFNGGKTPYVWVEHMYATWEVAGGKLINTRNMSFYNATSSYVSTNHSDNLFYEIEYENNMDGLICYRTVSVDEGFHVRGDKLYIQRSATRIDEVGNLSVPLGTNGKFRVELRGGEHKIFINGVIALTVNSLEYLYGTGFGIGTNKRSSVASVKFDNLRIESL